MATPVVPAFFACANAFRLQVPANAGKPNPVVAMLVCLCEEVAFAANRRAAAATIHPERIRGRWDTMDMAQGLQILGLTPDADAETARRAWRALVRQWHPDRYGQNPQMRTLAEERLKEINLAWAVVAPRLPPGPGGGKKHSGVPAGDTGAPLFRSGILRSLRRIHLRRVLREIFSDPRRSPPVRAAGPDSPASRRGAGNDGREKSFDEVFDEVSEGGASRKSTRGAAAGKSGRRHRPVKGRGGTQSGTGAVEGVAPAERLDRIGRTGRIRGIGRKG